MLTWHCNKVCQCVSVSVQVDVWQMQSTVSTSLGILGASRAISMCTDIEWIYNVTPAVTCLMSTVYHLLLAVQCVIQQVKLYLMTSAKWHVSNVWLSHLGVSSHRDKVRDIHAENKINVNEFSFEVFKVCGQWGGRSVGGPWIQNNVVLSCKIHSETLNHKLPYYRLTSK